ncbi:PD-(D/E)XK nuclease family protein [Salinicoccus roseus]|uniref:PD-(D/E)XK nuclease family protein n=1 Tax=Salinicoccus roseus TaxID=45670 RepID=UPI0023000A37|nr:PD-(D/E)XK nuclease family protein [Salinicoccus roseus]
MNLDYFDYNPLKDYFPLLHNIESGKDFNLFQITGYPHYENVASRVFEFFFKPEERHGLGTLFLKALAEFIDIDSIELLTEEAWQIEREHPTYNNNRIDLLLVSDSYVIGIENKVWASEHNDLNDYDYYMTHHYKEKILKKVILSLNASKFENPSWINITYEEFFKKINILIEENSTDSNPKAITLLYDFIENFSILKGDKRLNMEYQEQLQSFEKFIDKNYAAFKSIEKDFSKYKNECRRLRDDLFKIMEKSSFKETVNKKINEELGNTNLKSYPRRIYRFNPPKAEMFSTIVIDTPLSVEENLDLALDFQFGFNSSLSKSGFSIKAFIREKDKDAVKSNYTPRIKMYHNNPKMTDDENNANRMYHFFIPKEIWGKTDQELLETLEETYIDIICKLDQKAFKLGK